MNGPSGCFLPVTYYGDTRVECECGWAYTTAAWVTMEANVVAHRLGKPVPREAANS